MPRHDAAAPRDVSIVLSTVLALGGCSAGSAPVSARPVASAQPSATPAATGSGGSSSGGTVAISVPTPAPILCTPSTVSVAVDERTVVACSEQGYDGAFSIANAATSVASVQQAAGTTTLFYVSGVAVGNATVALQSALSGTGSFGVTVTP